MPAHGHSPNFRFLESKVVAKEVIMEKLALKCNTTKAAIAKLEAQVGSGPGIGTAYVTELFSFK